MIEFLKAVAAILLFGAGLRCFVWTYRLLRGNTQAYEQNRLRTGSFWVALFGRVPSDFDGRRDYNVSAGIAINRNRNEWVDQGRLSAEAVEATVRH
jgi:hypothetical protein